MHVGVSTMCESLSDDVKAAKPSIVELIKSAFALLGNGQVIPTLGGCSFGVYKACWVGVCSSVFLNLLLKVSVVCRWCSSV